MNIADKARSLGLEPGDRVDVYVWDKWYTNREITAIGRQCVLWVNDCNEEASSLYYTVADIRRHEDMVTLEEAMHCLSMVYMYRQLLPQHMVVSGGVYPTSVIGDLCARYKRVNLGGKS